MIKYLYFILVLAMLLLSAWYLPKVKASFEERFKPKPLPQISYQVPDPQSGLFLFRGKAVSNKKRARAEVSAEPLVYRLYSGATSVARSQ